MESLINEMLEHESWAVVGASANKSKYGNTVFHKLMKKGLTVYLVNPKYEEIEGHKVYPDLESVDGEIDCISMVVNQSISEETVKSAIKLGIKYIWFQPNTYNSGIIDLAENAGIKVVYGTCILWT